jgi:hypothetical protein
MGEVLRVLAMRVVHATAGHIRWPFVQVPSSVPGGPPALPLGGPRLRVRDRSW